MLKKILGLGKAEDKAANLQSREAQARSVVQSYADFPVDLNGADHIVQWLQIVHGLVNERDSPRLARCQIYNDVLLQLLEKNSWMLQLNDEQFIAVYKNITISRPPLYGPTSISEMLNNPSKQDNGNFGLSLERHLEKLCESRKLLIEKNNFPYLKFGGDELSAAVVAGNHEKVNELLRRGICDVNKIDNRGNSTLVWALIKVNENPDKAECKAILQALLEHGASLDSGKDSVTGKTPREIILTTLDSLRVGDKADSEEYQYFSKLLSMTPIADSLTEPKSSAAAAASPASAVMGSRAGLFSARQGGSGVTHDQTSSSAPESGHGRPRR